MGTEQSGNIEKPFDLDSEIGVMIGCAMGHGCIGTRILWGRVEQLTTKAVRLSTDYGPIWFPCKSLRPMQTNGIYLLARWFRPNDYQSRIFDRVDGNVVSAKQD